MTKREKRLEFFKNVANVRLSELTEIAEKHARPWNEKLGLKTSGLAEIGEDWYRRY